MNQKPTIIAFFVLGLLIVLIYLFTNPFVPDPALNQPLLTPWQETRDLNNFSFYVVNEVAHPGQEVQFVAQINNANEIDFWWDFGDGTIEPGNSYVQHSYSKPGNYTVTLIAKNSAGQEFSVTKPELVRVDPQAETRRIETIPGEIIYMHKESTFVEKIYVAPDKVEAAIAQLAKHPDIIAAQPNYLHTINNMIVTANPAVPMTWQEVLECPRGEFCGGDEEVTIAVIDTGMAYTDYDDSRGSTGGVFLQSRNLVNTKLFVNPGEIPGDGNDNDCNGLIDDYNGVDTLALSRRLTDLNGNSTCPDGNPITFNPIYKKEGLPVDTHGHGTFVTGQIMDSPAFKVTILPIAVTQYYGDTADSMSYFNGLIAAGIHGADVINISMGQIYSSQLEEMIIDQLHDQGIILIAAAANQSAATYYPADYDNVLGVAADPLPNVEGHTYSCYPNCGKENINNGFKSTSAKGNSYGSPQIAALVAIIKSINPDLDSTDIRALVGESAANTNTLDYDAVVAQVYNEAF